MTNIMAHSLWAGQFIEVGDENKLSLLKKFSLARDRKRMKILMCCVQCFGKKSVGYHEDIGNRHLSTIGVEDKEGLLEKVTSQQRLEGWVESEEQIERVFQTKGSIYLEIFFENAI